MRTLQDVAAAFTHDLSAAADLATHLVRCAGGQGLFDVDAAVKTELVAELPLHLLGIHDVRLQRVEHIQPDLDQVGEERTDRAVRVLADHGACPVAVVIDQRQPRLDETPPHLLAEHQLGGRTPVVGEVEAIDAQGQLLVDNRQVPLVNDAVQQVLDELRLGGHIDEKLLHTADAPGALEEHHAQLAKQEQIAAVAVGQLLRLVETAGVERIGDLVARQRFGQRRATFDLAQRVTDRVGQPAGAVPHTAELVGVQTTGRIHSRLHRPAAESQLHLPDLAGPRVVVEVGTDLDDVIADERCRSVVVGQPIQLAHPFPHRRHGVEVVGHEIGLLVADGRQDARTFVHRLLVSPPIREMQRKRDSCIAAASLHGDFGSRLQQRHSGAVSRSPGSLAAARWHRQPRRRPTASRRCW